MGKKKSLGLNIFQRKRKLSLTTATTPVLKKIKTTLADPSPTSSCTSTPRMREPRKGKDAAATTPKIIVHACKSRGFLESPVSVVDQILSGDEDDHVVDLSLIELPPTPPTTRKASSARGTSDKFVVLDTTGPSQPAKVGAAPTVVSPEILVVAETRKTSRVTPKRTVRFSSPKRSLWQNLKRPFQKYRQMAPPPRFPMPPPRSYFGAPPVLPLPVRYNFAPNFRGAFPSEVPRGVFEFRGNRDSLFPPLPPSRRRSLRNVYIPEDIPQETRRKGSLRPIVIDGSNVAMAHGAMSGGRGSERAQQFSCRGIDYCIDFFKRRGHEEVVAIVPHFRLRPGHAKDQDILHRLERENLVLLSPSRTIPGRGSYQAYDDRFIVQYAALRGGVIVSNDNFRDLLGEGDQMREAIECRLLQYNWLPGSALWFPPDPLGKNGPNLDTFLQF